MYAQVLTTLMSECTQGAWVILILTNSILDLLFLPGGKTSKNQTDIYLQINHHHHHHQPCKTSSFSLPPSYPSWLSLISLSFPLPVHHMNMSRHLGEEVCFQNYDDLLQWFFPFFWGSLKLQLFLRFEVSQKSPDARACWSHISNSASSSIISASKSHGYRLELDLWVGLSNPTMLTWKLGLCVFGLQAIPCNVCIQESILSWFYSLHFQVKNL